MRCRALRLVRKQIAHTENIAPNLDGSVCHCRQSVRLQSAKNSGYGLAWG